MVTAKTYLLDVYKPKSSYNWWFTCLIAKLWHGDCSKELKDYSKFKYVMLHRQLDTNHMFYNMVLATSNRLRTLSFRPLIFNSNLYRRYAENVDYTSMLRRNNSAIKSLVRDIKVDDPRRILVAIFCFQTTMYIISPKRYSHMNSLRHTIENLDHILKIPQFKRSIISGQLFLNPEALRTLVKIIENSAIAAIIENDEAIQQTHDILKSKENRTNLLIKVLGSLASVVMFIIGTLITVEQMKGHTILKDLLDEKINTYLHTRSLNKMTNSELINYELLR